MLSIMSQGTRDPKWRRRQNIPSDITSGDGAMLNNHEFIWISSRSGDDYMVEKKKKKKKKKEKSTSIVYEKEDDKKEEKDCKEIEKKPSKNTKIQCSQKRMGAIHPFSKKFDNIQS
eukprot:753702_1